MSDGAAIVGWAHSPFGKLEDPDLESLMTRVVSPAIEHAGVMESEIDVITVGVLNNGFSRQGFESALVGTAVPGLAATPAVRVENACATGTAALYAALDRIDAGRARIALVVGAEKMTATPADDIADILLSASYRKEEDGIDSGFAGIFGRIAATYFQRYGDRSEDLAMIAAKNHANGMENPFAHLRKDLGVDFCNTVSAANPRIAGPLRRTDCSPVSDGAAAIVVAAQDVAQALPLAIRFRARCEANDALPLSRRDPTAFNGAHRAWATGLSNAEVTLSDLDFVETHDCFTIAELIQYEAMGLTTPGDGARAVREGWTTRSGRLPVNVSGGLKSKGHPIGATGLSMHIMACMQLMGEAGGMQLQKPVLGGVFNMGGAAVTNYVSILERSR